MNTQRISLLLAAACLALGSSAYANLVTNGDFEMGNLTGWTLTENLTDAGTNLVEYRNGVNGYVMEFGSTDLGSLSQTLTTTPGQAYVFHFDLAAEHNTNPYPISSFQASWNGNTLMTVQYIDNATSEHWLSPNDFVVMATSTTTNILFEAKNPASYFSIDNVSVEELPEPATWAMALSGVGVFAAVRRMRSKVSTP